MKDWKSRLPAMMLAAALLTAAPLAVSGGRDVPDHIAEGSDESYAPVIGGDCTGSAVTRVAVGWLSFDIVTAPDGTVSMHPSLVRTASQILRRVLAPGRDTGDSCTAD
jgi:hypothetical protein